MNKRWLKIVLVLVSTIDCFMFLGMKGNWSGISKILGATDTNQSFWLMYFPFFVWLFMAAIMVLAHVDYLMKGKIKAFAFINLAGAFLSTVIVVVMWVMGCAEYAPFILPDFFRYIAYVASIYALYFLIFVLPKVNLSRPILTKTLLLIGLSLTVLVLITDKTINRITYQPVVYAVEDNYQIVFSCSGEATASVKVGENTYYETAAGYGVSRTKVHKVTVPMSSLDKAGSYTVYLQSYFYRGPFYSYKGKILSETVNFRPVDYADGVNYYCLSDVHHSVKTAAQAANCHKDLDFLVLIGDIASECDSYETANLANLLAYNITKGEIPVIYARGNHETKGRYSEELYKYVGSVNQNFYFWYKLNVYNEGKVYGHVKGFVLDFGEDHYEGWWEFSGADHFNTYRMDQLKFLKENEAMMANDPTSSYEYNMVVNHIPFVYVSRVEDAKDIKDQFVEELNKLNLDINVFGHFHQLMVFEPGYLPANTSLYYNSDYSTITALQKKKQVGDFNFFAFDVSQKSLVQKSEDKDDLKAFTGLYVKSSANNVGGTWFNSTSLSYTNNKGDAVSVVSIFTTNLDTGRSYGKVISYTKNIDTHAIVVTSTINVRID